MTRWRESPGTGGQHNEAYTSSYELRGKFEEADARDALHLAELLNAPASPEDCAIALGKLKSITMSRNVTAEDLTVQIAAMTEEIYTYPIDVARDACRASARSIKFFPTLAELRSLCDERVLFRRSLAGELRRHLDALEKRGPAQEVAPAKAPPACGVWVDNLAALQALPTWPILQRCIPDSDDGATLTLAVEAPGLAFAVLAWGAGAAGRIVGRNIGCIVKSWVLPALFERQIQIGGASTADPHWRNGETVTLDDPAWRIWRGGVAKIEGLACEAAVSRCLPDDLNGRGLVLAVPSHREASAILDHPSELAQAFGVPVRPRFTFWTSVANEVRAAVSGAAI